MNVEFPTHAKGRFKFIRHTGHVFDEAGNLLQLGEVLEETPFSDNLFTYYGSALYLNKGAHTLSLSVSGSRVPPTLMGPGVNYAAVSGRTSTALVEALTTRSGLPDAEGNLFWRTTYRFAFPAIAGLPTATFYQASAHVQTTEPFYVPLGAGAIPYNGGPVSASLLDSPFAVNMSNENFDLVWEFTETVNVEKTGIINVRVVDAFGVVKSSSAHTYTIRPANFFNLTNDHAGWRVMVGNDFPTTKLLPWSISCGTGTLGDYASQPTFDELIPAESVGLNAPWLGGVSCGVGLSYGFEATSTEEVNCIKILLDHTEWQIGFTPPISKKARHRFSLSFNLSVVDRGF